MTVTVEVFDKVKRIVLKYEGISRISYLDGTGVSDLVEFSGEDLIQRQYSMRGTYYLHGENCSCSIRADDFSALSVTQES